VFGNSRREESRMFMKMRGARFFAQFILVSCPSGSCCKSDRFDGANPLGEASDL
jgi:hypothetical protein